MFLKKKHRVVHAAGTRVGGGDFAFPLRLGQIPIGSKLLRIDRGRIVVDLDTAGIANVSENIFILRIDVFMFAAPPLGLFQ